MYKHFLLTCAVIAACIIPTSLQAKKLEQLPHIFYVTIPVETAEGVIDISAQYRLPRNLTAKAPAVVILHSSSGVDSTGVFYAKALNKKGIATLEVDLWGGRDLLGGSEGRPSSPQETLNDAFSALDFLAARDEIDSNKIGVLGFSWGGVLSLLTSTNQYASLSLSGNRFAGHVAHYPVCWAYNAVPGFEFSDLTGSPVLIQTGELDDYDLPDTCSSLVNSLNEEDHSLVTLKTYKNAYHAWDRLEPEWIVEDPTSHLGTGGSVTLAPNKKVAKKSKRRVVKFFSELFFD